MTFYKGSSYDYETDELEFSKFITEEYGIPYQLQQLEMLGQDTIVTVEIEEGIETDWEEGNTQLQKWREAWEAYGNPPAEEVSFSKNKEAWKSRLDFIRNEGPTPEVLIWDLNRQGKIPAGKYLIHIWW